jgi:transposase InsO family protein
VHFISDHARCFTGQVFRRKLLRLGVKQRFGAVGKKGSIALIERLWRTRRNAGRDRETGSWDLPCAQVLRRSERLYSLQSFHPTTRPCKPDARQTSRRGPMPVRES